MFYKHYLWNLPTKVTFFFLFNLSSYILFFYRILSYFAKPNFIIYDEWFDDDLEKNKLDVINKKMKNISKIHQFFYEQSNYKVGASENNLELDIKINEKELTTYNYFEDTFKKFSSVSNNKFQFFKTLTKNKFKFLITKKLIYSLSIFGFVFIFGFILFFISQSKKNESSITNKLLSLEKEF